MIYPDSNTWAIKKASDATILGEGSEKNLAAVKKTIKTKLKSIGVQFLDEVRNGDNTEKKEDEEVLETSEVKEKVAEWL